MNWWIAFFSGPKRQILVLPRSDWTRSLRLDRSGKSNVIFWLERRGMTPSDELVDRIFQRAKASDPCLTEIGLDQIIEIGPERQVERDLLAGAPRDDTIG